MNENIVIFSKIAARSFAGWLKVILIGGLISITGLIAAIILWSNNTGPGFSGGGHAGVVGALLGAVLLFVNEFWTALLFSGSLACMVFYTAFAPKYAIRKAIHLSWKNKLGDVFIKKMEQYLSRVFDKKDKTQKPVVTDQTLVKKELTLEVNKDPETNSIQKRIFRYILKRVRLDDVNFSDPELNIRLVILQKIRDMISDKIAPSMQPVWITAAIQLLVLILAIVFDHR